MRFARAAAAAVLVGAASVGGCAAHHDEFPAPPPAPSAPAVSEPPPWTPWHDGLTHESKLDMEPIVMDSQGAHAVFLDFRHIAVANGSGYQVSTAPYDVQDLVASGNEVGVAILGDGKHIAAWAGPGIAVSDDDGATWANGPFGSGGDGTWAAVAHAETPVALYIAADENGCGGAIGPCGSKVTITRFDEFGQRSTILVKRPSGYRVEAMSIASPQEGDLWILMAKQDGSEVILEHVNASGEALHTFHLGFSCPEGSLTTADYKRFWLLCGDFSSAVLERSEDEGVTFAKVALPPGVTGRSPFLPVAGDCAYVVGLGLEIGCPGAQGTFAWSTPAQPGHDEIGRLILDGSLYATAYLDNCKECADIWATRPADPELGSAEALHWHRVLPSAGSQGQ